MAFSIIFLEAARITYEQLQEEASRIADSRAESGKTKSSKQEGLFRQVHKCIRMLKTNPRHPGLATHPYSSLSHPHDKNKKVFEAYAQQDTPGAYRVFWCYGPGQNQITIIAITPHP